VSDLSNLWSKLLSGKVYREALVASQLKRGLPFQARAMRKVRGWSQALVAEKSGLTQGVVSRAEDPDYGNLTLNTVLRIAAGHDVAVICKFVPFGEFAKWYVKFSEETAVVPSFEEECASFSAEPTSPLLPVRAIQNPQANLPELPWRRELSGGEERTALLNDFAIGGKKQPVSVLNDFAINGGLAYAAGGGSAR
jgi:transcriptional regulator with XRE-family HTH domain